MVQVLSTDIYIAQAPGELPITPTITPGFCAAGVLLMLSGAAYSLVGIRYKYFQVFFSVAYLASLAVAVLILYVMSLPVSNSIQGAYVAGSIMAGIVVGAASLILVDMLHGLGCLLGGFTLSMWLLVLKPGGLIASRGGRVGFIAAITLAGFSTSFSHIVRPYALILFISFSGSTAIVLGIDCFSRAGLKEFWVYLWDINNDIFAIGTTTYPISKGLYAEIAVIVVLSLAGIASQTKLWKVVKEKRDQRAAEQVEDDKARAEEEANIGRCVEVFSAQDRAQWEAAHGAKDEFGPPPSDRDSGVGDMDSQNKGTLSTATSVVRPEQDEIETVRLAQPSPASQSSPIHHSYSSIGGIVTVYDVKDVGSESEFDADRKSIAKSTIRSSYTSAKHLSNGDVPKIAESDQENPTQTILEAVASTMPKGAAVATQEKSTNATQEEVTNTAREVVEGEATYLNTKEPQETHMVSENANPIPEISVSPFSNTVSSTQQCSIHEHSSLSPSSEPSSDPIHDGTGPCMSGLSPHEPQTSKLSLNDCDISGSARLETSQQTPAESPLEDDLGPLPSSGPSTRRSSYIPFGDNTLMGKRDSILRNKTSHYSNLSRQSSTGSLPLQVQDSGSRRGSSGESSVYNLDYGLPSSPSGLDDDMPLSARRNLLRQPSSSSNPTHLVRRQYSGPGSRAREQQLASFRLGIQRERQSSVVPNGALERQRSMLWQEQQIEGQKKALEHRKKEDKEIAFDQSMRRGDMLNAHREAMRKMQAAANTASGKG